MFHIYAKSPFYISWHSAFWKVGGMIMISELIMSTSKIYLVTINHYHVWLHLNWFAKIIGITLITWRTKFISIKKLESGIDILNLSTWTNSKTTILVRISFSRSWKQTENIQLTFISNVEEQICSQGLVLFTDNPQASKYNKLPTKPHTYLMLQTNSLHSHNILIQT